MRHSLTFALVAALAGAACSTSAPDAAKPAPRAELRKVAGATIEVVPRPGQLPYCLVYTISATGLVRLLTQTEELESVPCEAGTPVGGVPYIVPFAEGQARVLVIFSDRVIKAGPVAQQISEFGGTGRKMSGFDLRAPGNVTIEELTFTPDAAPSGAR
jgi:hypothetical protein